LEKNKSWRSSRINSWSLLFLIYINDLPKVLIQNGLPIFFADDTSVVVMDSNIVDFQLNMKLVFEQINDWFNVNLLLLNFEKTGFIHFNPLNAKLNPICHLLALLGAHRILYVSSIKVKIKNGHETNGKLQ